MRPTAAFLVAACLLLPGCGGESDDRSEDLSVVQAGTAEAVAAPLAQASSGEPARLPHVEFVADLAPATAEPAPQPPPPAAPAAASPAPDDLVGLRAAVEKNPGDALARRRLALALNQAGLRQDSVPHFEKALELDPGPGAHLDLGIAYASVSRLDDAETEYLEVLRLSPGDPRALHNLGNLAFRRNDYGRALDYYGQAIEAKPDYLLAYFHAAETLRANGSTEQAYGAYLTVLEMTPASPQEQSVYNDAVYQLASLALSLGQAAQAENLLSQLVVAAPDHGAAHYARGQALLQLGREEEAQREFEAHQKIMSDKRPTSAAATEQ